MIAALIMLELVCIWVIGEAAAKVGLMSVTEYLLLVLVGVNLYQNYGEKKCQTTDSI